MSVKRLGLFESLEEFAIRNGMVHHRMRANEHGRQVPVHVPTEEATKLWRQERTRLLSIEAPTGPCHTNDPNY